MQKIQDITSPQNPRIKNIVRLRTRRARDAARTMIIEGELELERAMAAGIPLQEVYFNSDGNSETEMSWLADSPVATGAALFRCDRSVYAKIAYGDRDTGILALASYPEVSLDSLALAENPLVIVLEAVEKPGNLGAVLRSADGAGADAVIIADPTTDLYNPNTIRASRGALFTVPVACGTSGDVLAFLKNNGITVVATLPDADTPYTDVDMTAGVAMVMGTEHEGLSCIWAESADAGVAIPMRGAADSLNVAVTATIMMYEALRQRSVAGSIE